MIQEIIACDELGCDEAELMRNSVVPDHWISFDGRHFCSAVCLNCHVQNVGALA